jgi:hypothetical protein
MENILGKEKKKKDKENVVFLPLQSTLKKILDYQEFRQLVRDELTEKSYLSF